MDNAERDQRLIHSLTRLQIATRSPKLEPEEFVIFSEHTQGFDIEDVEDACASLERTATWMPKVSELLNACRESRRRREYRALELLAAQAPRQLPAPEDYVPPTREEAKAFMANFRARVAETRREKARAEESK
jgi:hypothetical protein